MNLSKLFFWIKKNKGYSRTSKPSYNFDQKLIKKIRTNLIPKWAQFRYLGNFLTTLEKRIIHICALIFILSSTAWGVVWFLENRTIVPAHGGDYTEALIGEPKYINPLFASTNDVDADLTALLYSGLFKYNTQTQSLNLDLAENYTISEDGRIYEITLRKDVVWSDGDEFNADDILFTFQTIQDPEVGSPLISAFQGITIEKINDFAIRFTLKDPFSPFLNSLTVGILPEHIWSNIPPSGIRLAKTNLQPIGTGPWKFSKLTKDSSGNIQNYILEANTTYYQTLPYLKTLTFKFYGDFIQAATALKSQDADAISFLPNDLTDKIVGKNFQSQEFELPQYTAIFFNQDSAALKDSDIRLALTLATDKNYILNTSLKNKGRIIDSPILAGMIGYKPTTTTISDRDKANELLNKNWKKIEPEDFFKTQYETVLKTRAEEIDAIKNNTTTPDEERTAQIKAIEDETAQSVREDMNADQGFYRKNKNNEILSVVITTVDTPEYQQVATDIAKMWRAIGVKTNINTSASNQISREVLRNRSYEALLYGEIIGADSDPYPFWHSSQIAYPGLNLSLFTNRTADKLLEDARATTTEQARAENYQKFQDILIKENPAIFLYTPIYNFVFSKEIKGINFKSIPSPSDRFNTISEWYIKTKRQWNGTSK